MSNPTTEMIAMALCQDCCRLHPICNLTPDDNDPPGLCPVCGGSCCNCAGCLSSVEALSTGNWSDAGLRAHTKQRVVRWTSDGGLVLLPDAKGTEQ
jgi:hypothetical protein